MLLMNKIMTISLVSRVNAGNRTVFDISSSAVSLLSNMQGCRLCSATFLLVSLLSWDSHGYISPNETLEFERSYCNVTQKMNIVASLDHSQRTTVYFNHSKKRYRSDGFVKRSKPINLELEPVSKRENVTNSTSERYMFFTNINIYTLKDEGDIWRFVGYNGDWVKCPQEICLDGTVEAAVKGLDNWTYFINYDSYWKTRNLEEGNPFTTRRKVLKNQINIDAALRKHETLHLVKGATTFEIVDFDDGLLAYPDRISLLEGSCANDETRGVANPYVVFLEETYCVDAGGWVTYNMSPMYYDLDATLMIGSRLIAIKRFMYFNISFTEASKGSMTNAGEQGSSVFKGLFGCEDEFYSERNLQSADDYYNNVSRWIQGFSEEDWLQLETPPTTVSVAPSNTAVIVAIIVGVVLCLIIITTSAIIVMVVAPAERKRRRRRRGKRKKESSSKKEKVEPTRVPITPQSNVNATPMKGSVAPESNLNAITAKDTVTPESNLNAITLRKDTVTPESNVNATLTVGLGKDRDEMAESELAPRPMKQLKKGAKWQPRVARGGTPLTMESSNIAKGSTSPPRPKKTGKR